jgi:hypothetical protein
VVSRLVGTELIAITVERPEQLLLLFSGGFEVRLSENVAAYGEGEDLLILFAEGRATGRLQLDPRVLRRGVAAAWRAGTCTTRASKDLLTIHRLTVACRSSCRL